ncbi:MAG: molecular chaperone TorD family protein [Desulfurococcales archaeon]|nr:molecular chaperone TorD family protein [Desulfurococcales archaeon]
MDKLHRTYSRSYRLLGIAFLPPSTARPLLNSHTGDIIDQLLETDPELEGWHPKIGEAVNNVKTLASNLKKCLSDDGCWETFASEYSSLTVSGYKHVKCPPYESVYVVHGGYKMIEVPAIGESLDRYYSLLGLKADKEKVFGSDNISVELEFLAALHDAEALALKGSLIDVNPLDIGELRGAFMEDHLSKWTAEFTSCLKNNTGNSLITNMAVTLESLLLSERYL